MKADLCVRTSDFDRAIGIASGLGLDLVCIAVPPEGLPELARFREKRDWRLKPRLALGTFISSDKPSHIIKAAASLRASAEVIIARGGTEELNRAILETPEIDILIGHQIQGRSGINHVLARLSRKNNVSIGFDFNCLMASYQLGRVQEFSAMAEAARAVRHARAPFIFTSGAQDPWDMRSPSELTAMARQLGFTEAEASRGLGDEIVRENRRRLSGKWVMPGVEID